jgi:molybdopterin-containing oxidoreductase family membrane subunit
MYCLRKFLNFERYIGQVHLDSLGKLLITLSLIWSYINILELFSSWYGGTSFELEALQFRLTGFYAPLYWEMILFCAFVPLLMLFKKIRWSWNKMLVISILINIGMLTERFIIVATSQPRKFLPDAFGYYVPSWIEISITIGSFAIFSTLFLIFIKWVPSISLYEVKETLKPLRRDA